MRISDWSSDVCSSDLATVQGSDAPGDRDRGATAQADDGGEERIGGRLFRPMGNGRPAVLHLLVPAIAAMGGQFGVMVDDGVQDRKSVVEGKRVTVSGELGWSRNITKKKISSNK